MTILEAANLKSCECCYDFRNYKTDMHLKLELLAEAE